MTVTVEPLRVTGVKEALAELNSIDKRLRRSFTAEYKTIVQPMVAEARHLVPVRAPMSGWNRRWTPRSYTQDRSRYAGRAQQENILPWFQSGTSYGLARQIKPFLSGKRPRTYGGRTRSIAAMGMRWGVDQSVLFDQSGQASTPQGERMIRVLGARYGAPSRVMWRAYERTGPDVQHEIKQLVEKIMNAVGRKIQVQ